jgi:histidinol-phosphatase
LVGDLGMALDLADRAALVTMGAFGGRQVVRWKADATPVTAVDAHAEAAIRAGVAELAPADGVRGEEQGVTLGRSDRVWVVDPIDGTKMFAEGIPLWSTLIALKVGGVVTVAVADVPALGRRYYAVRGAGAWCGADRLSVSQVFSLRESLVLHAPVEEFAKEGGTGTPALLALATASRATRGLSDAWAHLMVAQGSAELLVEQGPCFEWDWAATSLIVEEAGGQLTGLEGGPPTDGCHLLVSNGVADDEVRQVLGIAVAAG